MPVKPVRIITARFKGECGTCKKPIGIGESIRYGGGVATTHETCAAATEPAATTRPAATRGRRSYGRRSYGYTSSGVQVSARCNHEDYPCCGC